MTRKICVVTGTRAEYGLLRWVMEGIREAPGLALQLVVTGMHLSPEFGFTFQEIEKDGFHIDHKVDISLDSDSPAGIAKSMGLGLIGFGEALQQLKPDIMLVLGDRFEIFSAVAAAMIARIPVAHLHGGEATEGLIDEPIRHSITKMSHLHFVAAKEYRDRVIQLGENPENVYLVGALGLDNVQRLELLDRPALEVMLEFRFGLRNLLVTFHPVTLEQATSAHQMTELLAALDTLQDTNFIFTKPNADTEGRILFEMIDHFVATHKNARAYTSLGQVRYLSCLRYVDGVIGNSSSGLIEVPSFGKGTINIGDRQRGRLKATSVIDCIPDRKAILKALQRLYSSVFQKTLSSTRNPYGMAGASKRVVGVLASVNLDNMIKKRFFDLPKI